MNYFSSSNSNSVTTSKSAVCSKMAISASSLYYKPKLPGKDLELKRQIEFVLLEHKAYGYRRIAIHLGINKKRVQRIMKLFGIKARKFKKKPRFKKGKFAINSSKNLITDFVRQRPQLRVKSLFRPNLISAFLQKIYPAAQQSGSNFALVGYSISWRYF